VNTERVQKKLKFGLKIAIETPRKNIKIRRPTSMWKDDVKL